MNTIQAQSVLPVGNAGKAADIATNKSGLSQTETNKFVAKSDIYSSTAANDSFVAKVLTSSIGKTMGHISQYAETRPEKGGVEGKYSAQANEEKTSINIETVTNNVVGFVESAIGKLANKGVSSEKLQFFINEAAKGVEVGIDQAKLELVGIATDDLYSMIDSTRDSILDGLHKLSNDPNAYIVNKADNNEELNVSLSSAIKVKTVKAQDTDIDFSPKGFDMPKDYENKSFYTTNSSNLSFTVSGPENEVSREKIANLVNDIDSLANSFYRGDIQSAYQKSIQAGYSEAEMIGLAKQFDNPERFAQVKAYGDIQHLKGTMATNELEAPKAVAEYINRYLGIIDASKDTLNSEQDFNEVINGLVNQMKDVQVPDLLHAINKFHAFNSKFK